MGSISFTLQLPKDVDDDLYVVNNQNAIAGTAFVLTPLGAPNAFLVSLNRHIKCLGALEVENMSKRNLFFEDPDEVSVFDFNLEKLTLQDTFHGIPNQTAYGYTMRYYLTAQLMSSADQAIKFEEQIKVVNTGVLPMRTSSLSLESNGLLLRFPRNSYLFGEEIAGCLRANFCFEDSSKDIAYKKFEVHLCQVVTGKNIFWGDGQMSFGKTNAIQSDKSVKSIEFVVKPKRLGTSTIVSIDKEVTFKLSELVLFPSTVYSYFNVAYKVKVFAVSDDDRDLKGEQVVTLVRG